MVQTDPDAPPYDVFSGVGRAVCCIGWGGAVVGGVVGTIDWPVVGTFFGALFGVVAGVATGVVDGLVLAGTAHRRWPVWSTRVVSALVVFLAALLVTRRDHEFSALAQPAGRITVVLACVVTGALVGPLIAYGAEPMIRVRRGSAGIRLARLATGWLVWGAVAGAVPGGVVGWILGIEVDLATAPFAVVEGAILGSVSGIVLAGLVGAAAIGPRLRVHR